MINRFKGLKLTPLKFQINYKGVSFNIIQFEFSIRNKTNTIIFEHTYSFIHFGVYIINDCGSKIIRTRASLFFKVFTIFEKALTPKWDTCKMCDDWCKTKEHYVDDNPICSEECKYFFESILVNTKSLI